MSLQAGLKRRRDDKPIGGGGGEDNLKGNAAWL